MALIIVLVVAAVVLVWGISTYNGFVRGDVNVEEAFATMDVYLKKRFDLIPNLVETVKGYAAHEAETLQSVIAARNAVGAATTPSEKSSPKRACLRHFVPSTSWQSSTRI